MSRHALDKPRTTSIRPMLAVTDLRVTVYGMKEFEVRDPENDWLWFGQETDDPPTVCE
jgi:hypothetical protein